MARNKTGEKFLIKKIWLIGCLCLIGFSLAGYLMFRFRSHPFIMALTDNQWVFKTVNQLAKITDIPFSFYYFSPNRLPYYQLFIKGNDLETLQEPLNQAQQNDTIMVDFNQVPATFISDNNETYKVNIRYRGNTAIHWAFPKKSWRISFRGKDSLNQIKTFDLIIPEDRGLIMEHLANFRAKKLNLLFPDSWFINLNINQKSQGVYYVTERMDEDFIARRGLSGTLFGEKDNPDAWSASLYSSIDLWRVYPEDKFNPDFKYLKQLLDLVNDQNTTTAELLQLVDLDNFLHWQVHGLLMASFAQEKTRNNRLFYNHKINKFQLIPWDTGSRHESYEDLDRPYNPLADKLLADNQIRSARNNLLKEYLTDPNNLTEDIAFFETTLKQIYLPLMKDNVKFYANIKYLNDIQIYRRWLLQHFENLLKQL